MCGIFHQILILRISSKIYMTKYTFNCKCEGEIISLPIQQSNGLYELNRDGRTLFFNGTYLKAEHDSARSISRKWLDGTTQFHCECCNDCARITKNN